LIGNQGCHVKKKVEKGPQKMSKAFYFWQKIVKKSQMATLLETELTYKALELIFFCFCYNQKLREIFVNANFTLYYIT
jgi:hypothetical protein